MCVYRERRSDSGITDTFTLAPIPDDARENIRVYYIPIPLFLKLYTKSYVYENNKSRQKINEQTMDRNKISFHSSDMLNMIYYPWLQMNFYPNPSGVRFQKPLSYQLHIQSKKESTFRSDIVESRWAHGLHNNNNL
jgi:hypothetical protein